MRQNREAMNHRFRLNPPLSVLVYLLLSLLLSFLPSIFSFDPTISHPQASQNVLQFRENGKGELVQREQPRIDLLAADESADNSSFILAAERTRRNDPFNGFKVYTGGWNISNTHYWASVVFTAAPFLVTAAVWFVLFGIALSFICLCHCCCRREPYGYSRAAYAISLILLIFFTVAAIVGCSILYTGQGKLHGSLIDTVNYIAGQVDTIAEYLGNVSDYLKSAKNMGVRSLSLPPKIRNDIDKVGTVINSTASFLSSKTNDNLEKIQYWLDVGRLPLIILAAVMLFLAFLGFLFSVLGLQCLVYTLVILGWFLVAVTFIICGVFLLLHNVIADACVSMDEWVQNPTAHTALDNIMPCVDNATAQRILSSSRVTISGLVDVVNGVVAMANSPNHSSPPEAQPLDFFNQSGPLVPSLCNPFNDDLTDRQCAPGEVDFSNASQVWSSYRCEVSPAGICTTTGRLTPELYNGTTATANVSYGLYRFGPFLLSLTDCSFIRQTFAGISSGPCLGLRKHTQWIYIGLFIVSLAVMLSLIFWVVYARERRHRRYTKRFLSRLPP